MSYSENLDLFAELSTDDETQLSGGYGCRSGNRMQLGEQRSRSESSFSSSGSRRFSFDLQFYIFGIGAAYLFGNPGVTAEEVQFVWERSLRFW
jgi:hypothetical protein